jgi:hypothetical protein
VGFRVLLPFTKDGFEQGGRTLHVVGPARRAGHRSRPGREGIDVPAAERRGQQGIREAFEQADNPPRRYGGTGRGLSIGSRLVE